MHSDDNFSFTESGTLYSKKFDDTYFMDGKGLEETNFIFLGKNQVPERLETEASLTIGETGFGTGLNFLATWQAWRTSSRNCKLTFFSSELFPLDFDIHKQALALYPELQELSEQLLAKTPKCKTGFHILDFEEGHIQLILMYGDVLEVFADCQLKADAWYLDGFAPSKNPEMWNEKLFKLLAQCSHEGTTIATFTAAGFVRRGLIEAGFNMQKSAGFAGKRHMISGVFEPGHRRFAKSLPAWYSLKAHKPKQKPIIVGAGISGCSIAYEFAKQGVESIIVDKHPEPAGAASGNLRGMVMPMFTQHGNHQEILSLCGFSYSNTLMRELKLDQQSPIIELDSKNENQGLYQKAVERHGDSFISQLSQEQVQELYPDLQASNAFIMHEASAINPVEYAQGLFKLSKAQYLQNTVESISREDKMWTVNFTDGQSLSSDTLILAAGHECPRLLDMIYPEKLVNLGSLRGQVAHIPREILPAAETLPPLYGDKYLLKSDSRFLLGATFQEDDPETQVRESDFDELLEYLKSMLPAADLDKIKPQLEGRCSFRCKSKDYLPVVGPLPKISYYIENYGGNKRTHAASRMPDAEYEDGLYIATGFGSRGFTTAPACARILVEEILNSRYLFPCDLRRHLHPARFLLRKLRRGEYEPPS